MHTATVLWNYPTITAITAYLTDIDQTITGREKRTARHDRTRSNSMR